MSTQINVNVQRGNLVERAKLQQQQNRRQKLEADNRKKVEAKAKEEREKQEPLKPVPPLPIQLRRDELAAQRATAGKILLAPDPVLASGNDKGALSTGFAQVPGNVLYFNNIYPGAGFDYDPSGGPVDDVYSLKSSYINSLFGQLHGSTLGSADSRLISDPSAFRTHETLDDYLYSYYEEFAVTLGTSLPAPEPAVVSVNKLTSYKQWTVECWVRLGVPGFVGQLNGVGWGLSLSGPYFALRLGRARASGIEYGIGGVTISGVDYANPPANGGAAADPMQQAYRKIWGVDMGDANAPTLPNQPWFYPNPYVTSYPWPEGGWRHVAVIYRQKTMTVYLDGKQVITASAPLIEQLGFRTGNNVFRYTDMPLFFSIEHYGQGNFAGAPGRPSIHGFRFTPRVLYTAEFIPPASITTFA